MHAKRKALLAAGMLLSAAALTGCTAGTAPAPTPTPKAVQQQTAQPTTAQPTAAVSTAAPKEEEVLLSLTVDEKALEAKAISRENGLLLPLNETGEALGWKAQQEEQEEDGQTKRTVTLEKEESRITVSWTVSDNTIKGVAWQKDGLLVPVNARLLSRDGVTYAPAAFFEEAMDAGVSQTQTSVMVSAPKPMDTPQTKEESSGENG